MTRPRISKADLETIARRSRELKQGALFPWGGDMSTEESRASDLCPKCGADGCCWVCSIDDDLTDLHTNTEEQ